MENHKEYKSVLTLAKLRAAISWQTSRTQNAQPAFNNKRLLAKAFSDAKRDKEESIYFAL